MGGLQDIMSDQLFNHVLKSLFNFIPKNIDKKGGDEKMT